MLSDIFPSKKNSRKPSECIFRFPMILIRQFHLCHSLAKAISNFAVIRDCLNFYNVFKRYLKIFHYICFVVGTVPCSV